MGDYFNEKYGIYEGIDTSIFKHIPEISYYNHNYYIGLKRDDNAVNDLIFAESDDDNTTEYFHINGDVVTYIGYEYTTEGILHISENRIY